MNRVKILMMLMVLTGMTACGSRHEAVLTWPELKAMDREVEELDGLLAAAEPDEAALAEHLPHVQAALAALTGGEVPKGVAHPELVAERLGELKALEADVGRSAEALSALHPLVVSILEAAGMPHVHEEHESGHGHEPFDGDHGHGH